MTMTSTKPTMNTLNGNRTFTAAQLEHGAKLAAMIETAASDLAKLGAELKRAGYSRDSLGQWFHNGQLIPSPEPKGSHLNTTGVVPFGS